MASVDVMIGECYEPETVVTKRADPEYIALIWEEFFRSRGRGFGIETHFPWMSREDPGSACLILRDERGLAGGLVVRDVTHCMVESTPRVGAIGLVCVEKSRRGRGYSGILLRAAEKWARENSFAALTLWTSKHDVYLPIGFEVKDDSLFGWARGNVCVRKNLDIERHGLQDGIGLPPFAADGCEYVAEGATCRLIMDEHGPILAAWNGDERRVVDLLGRAMPTEWRINIRRDDSLLPRLIAAGVSFDLKESLLQMWKTLDATLSAERLLASSNFTVFDRI